MSRTKADNRRQVTCVATVRDPHHDMRCEWGMTEGHHLYHRPDTGGPWQKVKRISYTPRRIQMIAWLIDEVERMASEGK